MTGVSPLVLEGVSNLSQQRNEGNVFVVPNSTAGLGRMVRVRSFSEAPQGFKRHVPYKQRPKKGDLPKATHPCTSLGNCRGARTYANGIPGMKAKLSTYLDPGVSFEIDQNGFCVFPFDFHPPQPTTNKYTFYATWVSLLGHPQNADLLHMGQPLVGKTTKKDYILPNHWEKLPRVI